MIKFVDLFAGIGGIRLGVEQACKEIGISSECVLSSEIDKKACETYELNFNENPYGDVRELSKIKDFDIMLAGFPCQTFSYAGKQMGFGDTRGTLFFEIERLLKENKPKAFILENVRGLITNDRGRTFKTILKLLENIGYGVSYVLLNSSNFNVPQNRVRIYILGMLGKTPKITITTNKGAPDSHKFKKLVGQATLDGIKHRNHKIIEDILEADAEEKYYCSDNFTNKLRSTIGNNLSNLDGKRLIDYRNGNSLHSWNLGIKGTCTRDEIAFMDMLIKNRRKKVFGKTQDGKMLTIKQIRTFNNQKNIREIIGSLIKKGYLKEVNNKYNPVSGNMSFEIFKFLDPKSVSITLVSSDAHKLGVVVNNRPRRITPREAARIQGFPDSFKLHNNDLVAYKQLGNSVSVPVIKEVMIDFLKNNWL